MKKEIIGISSLLSVALLLFGCANQSSGPAPSPGRSNLIVTIRAEPKRGWQPPIDSPYNGLIAPGRGGAFTEVDYSSVDDIVVWVDPGINANLTNSAAFTLDVARPSVKILATGLSDTWNIENSGAAEHSLFVRCECGKVFNIGTLKPGERKTFVPREPGLIELMSDSSERPLARVYIAPVTGESGKLVRVVRSGTKQAFIDLAPGQATVSAWHERLPGSTVSATLLPGQITAVTATVGVNSLPPVP